MGTVEFMDLSDIWMVPVIMLIAAASVAVIVIVAKTIFKLAVKAFRTVTNKKYHGDN